MTSGIRGFRIEPYLLAVSCFLASALTSFNALASPAPASPAARPVTWDQTTGCWSARGSVAPPLPADTRSEGEPGTAAGARTGVWTFAPNVRAHPETSGQHLWPDITVAPDGMIAVAWMDDHDTGGYHIFCSFSADGGATWSAPERVDDRTTGTYSKFVSLAFTPSNVPLAVWEDNRNGDTAINVYFSKRVGVNSWSSSRQVNTAGSPPGLSYFMNPSIAVVDENRYFVAWTDWREGTYYQVYERGTWDGGVTWGDETRISDEIGYLPVAGDPCLIADPTSGPAGTEVLYCVMDDWRGTRPAYPNVYFSRSTNGGASWSDGVMVNDVSDYYQQTSSRALVHLADGTLVTGWMSGYTSYTYRSCYSTDQGVTWSASVRVDDPALGGVGTWSSITSWENAVFAGFDCYQGTWNSYFRPSVDGRAWTDPVVRMDDDTGTGATGNTVLVATSAGAVVSAFQDSRLGPWLIYTARGAGDVTGVGEGVAGVFPDRPVICAPNPSRVGTPVRLVLSAMSGTTVQAVTIYDPAGRRLRSLAVRGTAIGWDGRDENGREVPSGAYWACVPGSGRGMCIVRIR
jgi:hypothetical protein